ncbi:hypothetical protein [Neobacillus cucumis]|uniref:hypothetical protein n=1 Tax=Neobacillus cucumis TaxID=1740721 RepID=UPI0019660380|nr:hypothetical protein [Neobacillus cucumis]MBM7651064.1 hypothetical protein [Neobacillus cucumis]
MKHLFIYILLFLLVMAVATLLDILQGLTFMDTLHGFLLIKQKMTGEELFLIFLFFSPLIISLSKTYFKKRQSSKSTFEE